MERRGPQRLRKKGPIVSVAFKDQALAAIKEANQMLADMPHDVASIGINKSEAMMRVRRKIAAFQHARAFCQHLYGGPRPIIVNLDAPYAANCIKCASKFMDELCRSYHNMPEWETTCSLCHTNVEKVLNGVHIQTGFLIIAGAVCDSCYEGLISGE